MATPTKAVIQACRRIRAAIRFRTAAFHFGPHETTPETKRSTEAIRRATRLYIESWVMPLIDAIEKGDTGMLQRLSGAASCKEEYISDRSECDIPENNEIYTTPELIEWLKGINEAQITAKGTGWLIQIGEHRYRHWELGTAIQKAKDGYNNGTP